MKRLIGLALLLSLPWAAAQAQESEFMLDDRYAYWGAELGNAHLQDLKNVCLTCEDSLRLNSYTLKFGFAFTEHLGVEARYLVLNNLPGVSGGSADERFFIYAACGGNEQQNCSGGAYKADFDYNSFGGVIKGRYPLLPNVNITGNVGRHFWNWNSDYVYTAFPGRDYWRIVGGQKNVGRVGSCQVGADPKRDCSRLEFAEYMKSRSSDDWTYGAGAEIHFGPNLQGEFAYNRMDGGIFHINNFSVGLALQF